MFQTKSEILLKGPKYTKLVIGLLNLPIELKPSLAPLVPRCLSFCDPDSLQLDFVGVVWSLRFSHLHDFLWPFKSKLNAVNKENWCVKYRNMNNLL